MSTIGEQLFAIINNTTVTNYPPYLSTSCQGQMYADLVAAFNQAGSAGGASVTDLRSDVYPFPLQYPPSTVFTIVSAITQPADLGDCQQSDWIDVYDQIKTETEYLVGLYAFQTAFQLSTQDVADALINSFSTAVNTLTAQESGEINFLNILQDIVGLGSLFPDLASVSTVLGAFLAVASSISGANGISGELDDLQTQMAAIINQANTQAATVYAPIAVDWGKLQQFQQLLPSLGASCLSTDYQTIGDQYEISLYQAVLPSTMAVVYFDVIDWNSCNNPSVPGQGLAYIPSSNGQNGQNETLCSRLTTLGVNLSDVCSRSGGWSGLQNWVCSSSFRGVYCTQR